MFDDVDMTEKLVRWSCLLIGLIVGGVVGYSLTGKDYLKGRFSACKDLLTVVKAPIPMECRLDQDDVYVVSPLVPNVKFKLDGEEVKN